MVRSAGYWKTARPRSLRHAIELCSKFALDKNNISVEGIAELMGLPSHWTLYKYMENGRMPAILIRPFEYACGCTYITQYIAISANKLIFDIPTGKKPNDTDLLELNNACNDAIKLLIQFYKGEAKAEDAINAITNVMSSLVSQRENVIKTKTPELELYIRDES